MKKNFSEISWDVSESEYRQDPALSYSTIAKYEREGFANLDKLFERVETPSLSFGSVVDCIMTDGMDEFNRRFAVCDIPSLEPSVTPIVKEIFEMCNNAYTDIWSIPDSEVFHVIEKYGYQPRWKDVTRCKVVREKGEKYYQSMFNARGKTIITQETYDKAFACVHALKFSPQTEKYFADDSPFSDVQHYYQLKFKANLDDCEYRCMADCIIVNYKDKWVMPVDLKTSSHREYEFPMSFLQWRYDIQGRLYHRIIKANMQADDYFKDFKLLNYRFIVVNNIDKPTPLVWEFSNTETQGDITFETRQKKVVLRDPEVIGKELYGYLQEQPSVPNTINLVGVNNIEHFIKNNM